jgi:hypothetical protein
MDESDFGDLQKQWAAALEHPVCEYEDGTLTIYLTALSHECHQEFQPVRKVATALAASLEEPVNVKEGPGYGYPNPKLLGRGNYSDVCQAVKHSE